MEVLRMFLSFTLELIELVTKDDDLGQLSFSYKHSYAAL
jgi:hypothetical protein